jgi:hypothetical protein
MKKSTLLGVVVLIVAAAVLLAGCTDEGPSAGTATTQAPGAVATQLALPSQSTLDQDSQFGTLISESTEALNQTIPKIQADMTNDDTAALQRDSAILSSQAGSYYTKIQALKVSPGYTNLQSNYLKFLDDIRNAADFYVKGTGALQAGDQVNGNKYLEQGNAYYGKIPEDMRALLGTA